MAIRTLWNAGTLSEFIAGLNGDCGPTATLSVLNWKNSQRWPLTATGLRAVDEDEISHGFAEANGAQNISHMDAYLAYLGVPHTTTGYQDFNIGAFHILSRIPAQPRARKRRHAAISRAAMRDLHWREQIPQRRALLMYSSVSTRL